MDKTIYLILGLMFGLLGPTYTFRSIYSHIKNGKIRTPPIFGYKVYSFKKNPTEAYWALALNCIVASVGVILGTLFILLYFNAIK